MTYCATFGRQYPIYAPEHVKQLANEVGMTELSGIDVDAAKQILRDFIFVVGNTDVVGTLDGGASVAGQAQIAEPVLDRVLPGWQVNLRRPGSLNRWSQHTEACHRAIAQLANEERLRRILGDSGPKINAGTLHPWIWDAARSLWQSGHYRQAVAQAAIRVNAELQDKIGRRDISEADLFIQAFSNDAPKEGAPRLRHIGDIDSRTDQSLRRGTRAFADGCYAAIRNPISHEAGDLSEPEALENLAAFSILARWVERAVIVTVDQTRSIHT